MKFRWQITLSVLLILSHTTLLCAQSEPDRIIAGEHLVRLWDAIKVGRVKISKAELNSLILNRHLSAILIPTEQPNGRKIIKTCYKVKTVFDVPDLEVSLDDFTQLLRYAKDGVFERTAALRDAIINDDQQQLATATESINAYLDAQSAEEKESSRRFVGALLADLEPTQTELADYVKDFRDYIEKDPTPKRKATTTDLAFFSAGASHPFSARTSHSVGHSLFPSVNLENVAYTPSYEQHTFNDKVYTIDLDHFSARTSHSVDHSIFTSANLRDVANMPAYGQLVFNDNVYTTGLAFLSARMSHSFSARTSTSVEYSFFPSAEVLNVDTPMYGHFMFNDNVYRGARVGGRYVVFVPGDFAIYQNPTGLVLNAPVLFGENEKNRRVRYGFRFQF